MTVRAMHGGAMEFLTKPVVAEVLLDAVHRALEADAATLVSRRAQEALVV
jgi:FixJ family two-component response regulator